MKKILLLLTTLSILCGCSQGNTDIEEQNPTIPVNPKEYIVSLGFFGEITDISESPLTRVETNDLYGIQVYSMPANGTEYKPYAYGLFDDKVKMTVKLLEGYKYKFESTMVVNGKERLFKNYDSKYAWPFSRYTDNFTKLENLFVYNNSDYMAYLKYGNGYLNYNGREELFQCPNIDRFYGENSEYSPLNNDNVSINMKRVIFGAKVIAEGLTEGKIDISIKGAPVISIVHPATNVEDIYTFENTIGNSKPMNWTKDDYTETISLSASWKKADGAIIPLVTQDITFKRNKLTTITIKVKDNSVNNGVDVSQDNTPMGDGGNITIDTSTR